MAQQQDFQFVVSRQDYLNFQHFKAKCQQLARLRSQAEEHHMQDTETYLSRILKIEEELKSYKTSIRQYTDRQIQQIDKLLRILQDHRSMKSQTNIDQISLGKIKSEFDRLSRTYNVSLKDLQIINSQVKLVIRNLLQDSFALHQKLNQCSQKYQNSLEQKQHLKTKVRLLNEKSINFDTEKQAFINNYQKLNHQNQFLRQSLQNKLKHYNQLEGDIQNLREKLDVQTNKIKQENILNEKKLKQKFDSQIKLHAEFSALKRQKQAVALAANNQIQGLSNKLFETSKELASKEQERKRFMKEQAQQVKRLQFVEYKYNQALKSLQLSQQVSINSRKQLQNIQINQKLKADSLKDKIKQLQGIIVQREMTIQQSQQEISILIRQNQQSEQKLIQEKERLSNINHDKQRQIIELIKFEQFKQTESEAVINQFKLSNQALESTVEQLRKQLEIKQISLQNLESKFMNEAVKLKKAEESFAQFRHQIEESQQIKKQLTICQEERISQGECLQALREEKSHLKKHQGQQEKKLMRQNENLSIQLKTTVSNIESLKCQNKQLSSVLNQVKSAKNKIQEQYCGIQESMRIQKQKNQEKYYLINDQLYKLREVLEDKQQAQQNLFREIDSLRDQAQNGRRVQQASNLIKMNIQTLQGQLERVNKEKNIIKKERQLSYNELCQAKMQIKFLNDDANSMKVYIDQLQQNLQKLSEEKVALKDQITLFKEQAECYKREGIEQLGIIDKLERELSATRKQLKHIQESIEPASIVRRSSLSKGQKSYYVKQMISEYGNQMKKNLLEIGALSHDQIKDLIVSELRELGNYLKRIQMDFE